jgi:LmbE family N-acetylglucosaminyl deacetylase
MDRILMHQIKDYLKSFLRPHNLLSIPQIVEKPFGENVLVLSPHFDDDIFGCGGTLYKHSLSGDQITIVYFTDGREGDPSVPDKALVEKRRKEEARTATALLGIANLVFLDQPDTKLKPTPPLIEKLAEVFTLTRPNLIYLPSFLDNHIDHLALNKIFLLLSAVVDVICCNICAYEIWTPLLPNIVVDITAVISQKRLAAEQYGSQIKQVDYVNTILALNRYRSITVLQGHGYAEAFLYTSAQEYINLLQSLHLERRIFIDRKFLRPIRKLFQLIRYPKNCSTLLSY